MAVLNYRSDYVTYTRCLSTRTGSASLDKCLYARTKLIVQNGSGKKLGALRRMERGFQHYARYAAKLAGGRTERRGLEPSTTLTTGYAPPSCTAGRRMYYLYLLSERPHVHYRDTSH